MKTNLIKSLKLSLFVVVLAVTSSVITDSRVDAQCPMCRMSVESNYKNGGTAGKGLNTGILYMLAMPYLLVGAIGYMWWRNRNQGFSESEEDNNKLR